MSRVKKEGQEVTGGELKRTESIGASTHYA
jgi:hypothetical protein